MKLAVGWYLYGVLFLRYILKEMRGTPQLLSKRFNYTKLVKERARYLCRVAFSICWLAKGRPWHTSPQTDTPLGLLRGMPRSSRISIIWANTNATVCGYTVLFQLSIILINAIPYTPTIPSMYAALFLLHPEMVKEHLQEYILPLRFYGRESNSTYTTFTLFSLKL